MFIGILAHKAQSVCLVFKYSWQQIDYNSFIHFELDKVIVLLYWISEVFHIDLLPLKKYKVF